MASNLTRRGILLGSAACAAVAGSATFAQGSSGQIRWIVGYPPGGSTDAIARLLSVPFAARLKETVIVDNRPGAGSAVGAAALAQSRPDGQTVMGVDNGTLIINPVAYSNLQYDPDRDFRPVGLYADINILLAVGRDQPMKTAAEFLDAARTSDSPIPYASPGIGSPLHLAMERLAREANIKLEHIPYRGMAPALNDVLAGVVPSIVIDYSVAREMIRSGDLKALATLSQARLPAAPDIPTMAESGLPGFSAGAWQGMVVPRDTPDDVVARLNDALAFALADKDVQARYAEIGLGMPPTDAATFATRWQAEKAILQPLIRDLGIVLQN